MTSRPKPPPPAQDKQRPEVPGSHERGTNAVEHEPDPSADPLPDGEHKYMPRSPYTAGND
jgi:hypothetical protein